MERLTRIGQVQPKSASEIRESRLGIGFEKLDRNVFDPEKAYDKLSKIGVKLVRIQSGWQRTEREEGVYDFSWIDSIVDNLIARGMEPWIDLCYGNELYTEMAKTVFGAVGCAPIFSEREKKAWHDYVVALVRHFKGRVRWYEIWNEPDGRHCWKHGVNATETALFNIDTAKAIKEADPQAKAIGAVLCGIRLDYFEEMFETGMADYVDAVSFHRYRANELDSLKEIRALRALINRYNPKVEIIQGESGTQSSSKGAGALRGGAWTERKQAKYLLRQRVADLSSEVTFTSHFTCVDMIEALNGTVGDKASYLDYGYFGVLSADFDENGFSTGSYSPKQAYFAFQTLCALFCDNAKPVDLPVFRSWQDSKRLFGTDYSGDALMSAGFEKDGAYAFCYWVAADLMTTDYEGTESFKVAGLPGPIRLIDPMDGSIYSLPEDMIVPQEKGQGVGLTLKNLPLKDYPLILTFGDFQ